jgi:adenylate cyclase
MAKEIERKFLVKPQDFDSMAKGVEIRQGYITSDRTRSVRVRIYGEKAFVTIKGETKSFTRDEYEYEIPVQDAREIMDRLCESSLIEKKRYRINLGGHTWEVDRFFGENDGLVVAEIELKSETEHVEMPSWIDREVTGDARYYNANLSKHPFREWERK